MYGGPTRSLAHLCEAQAAAGWEVEVITTLANGAEELPYTPGIPHENNRVKVVYYKRWTGDHSHFSPSLLWSLFWYLRRKDIRHVHIHSWWNLVTIPAVVICWLSGRRPLLSPRGMLSPYTLKSPTKRLFHNFFGRFFLRRTLLHATSKQELEEGQAIVPKWQGVVVGNLGSLQSSLRDDKGSLRDDNPSPEPLSSRRGTFVILLGILFLSRIHPKKGLDVLLEALSGVTFPWQLTVVGDGEEAYVQQLMDRAKELGLTEHILWRGWLDGEAKTTALAEADLMVLPSHNENFAHVVLEALAVGTPVVLSDQVGLKDYVLENDFGWVVPSGMTRGSYTMALEEAYRDTAKRDCIRRDAPAAVRRDFNAQVLVEQYRKAYELL